MAIAENPTSLDPVRAQYERFPVPPRDPGRELHKMVASVVDDLGLLNHHCYRGRRNFYEGFRVLVAGGGTGDAVVFLAHQLQDSNAEIVFLDVSGAAIDVARARMRERRFDGRVEWVEGSLLGLPEMGLGRFDFVNCMDVLHHLEDPGAGLAALEAVLNDGGAMALSLNGRYGRTGLEQVHRLLALAGRPNATIDARLEDAKQIVGHLPPTNWFQRAANLAVPYATMLDEDVVQTFLPARCRSYDVLDVHELVEGSGLNVASFVPTSRAYYDPEYALPPGDLRDHVLSLPLRQQQAIGELTWGTVLKHEFWATRDPRSRCSADDPESVPFFSRLGREHRVRETFLDAGTSDWTMQIEHIAGVTVALNLRRVPVAIRFVEWIDDCRTMGDIIEKLGEEFGRENEAELRRMCRHVIDVLAKHDLLVFRHVSTPRVPT